MLRAFLEGYVEGAARALSDTATALEIVNKYLPVDDPLVTFNVDTPEEYAKLASFAVSKSG